MKGLLQRGLLLSIPTWLAVTLVLALLGELRLSAMAFFAGSSLVMVLGLSLLAIDRPSKISIRTPILYSSIVLFTLSATFFVYSYLAMNAIELFYVALALLTFGTCEVLAGVRRTPNAMQTSYSMNKFRLWGFLMGIGFSLGIASTILAIWGNQLTDWSVPIALGFGLFFCGVAGFWLELRKWKR